MRNIAVTGGSGYMGSIVIQELMKNHSNEVRVFALDIREPHQKIPGVSYHILDVRAPEMSNVFAENDIHVVVHLAAVMPSKKSDPELEYAIDVLGTKNVLEACVKNNVEKIVVSSSGAAYGYYADNPQWITENDTVRGNERLPYSRHKRLVEEMLAEYRKNHPTLQQVVFRIGTIVGKNVSNSLVALFENKSVLAIKGSDSRFVFIWDQDVCGCIVQAIFSSQTGTFNVAGDGALTIYEIAKILNKKVKVLSPTLLSVALRVGRWLRVSPYGPEQIVLLQYRPVLDNNNLKNVFGYIPQKSSQEAFLYYVEQKKLRR
ncbi:SDR family oxidoreductase [Candidatus Uabimicrobium amorphum]|uniref:UDP-glucose 4-epimerase n=1 Tax=Uabimicrobium amorphum TaxID=2596890 RepID=A0A5S9F3B3_UABAM|nr:SDR family oxidoreductase [Candidatus Uabimicrobium amorphum]BBM84308.1 UDP-glucose 4-epimerase [Candidatus Uabimicrobium amorphum]